MLSRKCRAWQLVNLLYVFPHFKERKMINQNSSLAITLSSQHHAIRCIICITSSYSSVSTVISVETVESRKVHTSDPVPIKPSSFFLFLQYSCRHIHNHPNTHIFVHTKHEASPIIKRNSFIHQSVVEQGISSPPSQDQSSDRLNCVLAHDNLGVWHNA